MVTLLSSLLNGFSQIKKKKKNVMHMASFAATQFKIYCSAYIFYKKKLCDKYLSESCIRRKHKNIIFFRSFFVCRIASYALFTFFI